MEHVMLVPVLLAIAVPDDEEFKTTFAVDGANELLRELQRDFTADSSLLDYTVDEDGIHPSTTFPHLADGAQYAEGDAF